MFVPSARKSSALSILFASVACNDNVGTLVKLQIKCDPSFIHDVYERGFKFHTSMFKMSIQVILHEVALDSSGKSTAGKECFR